MTALSPDVRATPGPWSVERYGDGDGDSLVIHSGEDWRVCFMATPGSSPNAMARIEANANLIAAAPTLADEGQFLSDRLSELDWSMDAEGIARDFHGHVLPSLERFRAALAKAAGK